MPGLKKTIEYLLYLFIFLLPWQTVYLFQERFLNGVKWEYGSLGIYLTEILLWAAIFLQSIVWIKEKRLFKKESLPMFLFLIWGLVSVFWAEDRLLAGFYAFHLLEAVLLFFLILTAEYEKRKLIWALILAGSVQSLLAVFQFLTQEISADKWLGLGGQLPQDPGASVVRYFSGGSHRWLRAYGSFTHPNVLGGFLAICLLAGLHLHSSLKNNGWKIFLSLCLIVSSAGLFFSFSRSAWLGFALGALILFFRKEASKKILICLFVFLIFLSVIYRPLVSTRFSLSERLEIKSARERLDLTVQAGEIIKNNLILGVGLGNYTVSLWAKNPSLPAWGFQPVHNLYLMVWAELGLVGFVFFLFPVLKTAFSRKTLAAIFFPLLAISLFDHYFFTQYVGLILFWLVLALSSRSDLSLESH